METDHLEHMRTMWGINQIMPQFLRLPPSIINPLNPSYRNPTDHTFDIATSKIGGFKEEFIKKASDLMNAKGCGPSLPNQHAYARGDKLASLHSQNQMLEKENIELKKQLDTIQKNNPKHTSS
ncbi:MAG: hypothetical protein K8823_1118 [Cenarchaeum symbiont of Oopsacas minuta]|nr:hypothetical protein [Cenarchaeum symbiont of Oopsacas minuta]